MNQPLSRRSAIVYITGCLLLAACGTTTTSSTTTASATTSATPGAGAPNGQPPSGTPPSGAPGDTSGASSSNVNVAGSYTLSSGIASLSNKTFTASAKDTSAILVSESGKLTLTNVTVNTSGNTSSGDNSSFYGLNAAVLATSGGSLTMTGCTVLSSGSGANSVYATGTGTKITISNSTLKATGDLAHGVMATQGATLIAANVNIVTSGAHAATIATDRGGGTIIVTGGTMKTSGSGSPIAYSTGTIVITNLTGTASGSETVVVEGSNSVKIIKSSLTSTSSKSRGVMLYQSFSGDAQGTHSTFTMSGGSLQASGSSLFYVTNATGDINLTGVKLTTTSGVLLDASHNDQWGTKGSNGGNAVLTASGQTLVGNLVADSLSTITATLQQGSSLTGKINADNTAKEINLTLDATSKWTVTGNSYVTTITNTSRISGSSITNIIGNGHTVYYKASANSALSGKTYSLTNGGTLAPR